MAHPSIRHALTAQEALTRAWFLWLGLLPIPFIPFLAAVHRAIFLGLDSGRSDQARYWFLAVVGYSVVMFPAALFFRSHCFRSYWKGQAVSPRNYLLGNGAIWLTLASAGFLAAAAALYTHTLAPNILPAAVALLVYFTLYPAGCALIAHPIQDDPAQYDEPR